MKSTAANRQNTTERLIWTAGVVAGASLPHWPTLPLWAPVLLCTCIAWRLATDLVTWPLPNTTIRVGLAVITFAAVSTVGSTTARRIPICWSGKLRWRRF